MNLPLNDIDPDYQYYSDTNYASNINCEYYTKESFNKYLSAPNSIKNISLYHHNIRGLPENFIKMDLMLNGLKTQFDIIGLSETWLKESNCDLYNIKNYASYHKIRKYKDRGGIALYIKNGIERHDLDIDSRIAETIFIEINQSIFHTKKNILTGLFYKAPNQDIDLFNNVFSDLMKKVNKENIFFYSFYLFKTRAKQYNTIQKIHIIQHDKTQKNNDLQYNCWQLRYYYYPFRPLPNIHE